MEIPSRWETSSQQSSFKSPSPTKPSSPASPGLIAAASSGNPNKEKSLKPLAELSVEIPTEEGSPAAKVEKKKKGKKKKKKNRGRSQSKSPERKSPVRSPGERISLTPEKSVSPQRRDGSLSPKKKRMARKSSGLNKALSDEDGSDDEYTKRMNAETKQLSAEDLKREVAKVRAMKRNLGHTMPAKPKAVSKWKKLIVNRNQTQTPQRLARVGRIPTPQSRGGKVDFGIPFVLDKWAHREPVSAFTVQENKVAQYYLDELSNSGHASHARRFYDLAMEITEIARQEDSSLPNHPSNLNTVPEDALTVQLEKSLLTLPPLEGFPEHPVNRIRERIEEHSKKPSSEEAARLARIALEKSKLVRKDSEEIEQERIQRLALERKKLEELRALWAKHEFERYKLRMIDTEENKRRTANHVPLQPKYAQLTRRLADKIWLLKNSPEELKKFREVNDAIEAEAKVKKRNNRNIIEANREFARSCSPDLLKNHRHELYEKEQRRVRQAQKRKQKMMKQRKRQYLQNIARKERKPNTTPEPEEESETDSEKELEAEAEDMVKTLEVVDRRKSQLPVAPSVAEQLNEVSQQSYLSMCEEDVINAHALGDLTRSLILVRSVHGALCSAHATCLFIDSDAFAIY